MKNFVFELCAESLEAARVAEAGGANRIELCSDLAIGGLTPGHSLMEATVEALRIPVHVLIRPRGGDFAYSSREFALMRCQTLEAKAVGAAGVALGVLHPDGRIDVERTRELVELAFPLKVTFHRAFDETPEVGQALEDVIRSGADCLLTSGGAPNVLLGAPAIAKLREQAGNRLDVMAGGGLRLETLIDVLRRTGVSYLHGSLLRKTAGSNGSHGAGKHPGARFDTAHLDADLREAIRLIGVAQSAS